MPELIEPVQTLPLNLFTAELPDIGAIADAYGLTTEEEIVAALLLRAPNNLVTRYRLVQAHPNLRNFTTGGFLSILDRASEKLQPLAADFNWPADFRIYSINALGAVVLPESERRSLTKQDLHDRYWERLIQYTCRAVTSDVYLGKVNPADWEHYTVGNHTFHFSGIGASDDTSGGDKFVSILKIKDSPQHVYPGVLTTNLQYRTLKLLLANHGYIDQRLSLSKDGASNIRFILNQLNGAFREGLGYDLFDTTNNVTRGYALKAETVSKLAFLEGRIDLENIDLTQLPKFMPTGHIPLEKSVPYTPRQKKGVGYCESRFIEEHNTHFVIASIDALQQTKVLARDFDRHVAKPFLFLFQQDHYFGSEPKAIKFAVELTEAEALTLMLFDQSETVDMHELGMSEDKRLRARERYKSFMTKLEKLGFLCSGWESTRNYLRFPSYISRPINSQ
jgi:hypothetical protein